MISYPARFKPDKINGENAFFLQFIDFPEAFTQGYTLEELYEMGQDVLSLILEDYLEDNRELPDPSCIKGNDVIVIEPYPRIAIPIILKKIRKENCLTQKDVASKLGVSYQTYQKMERGQSVNPTLATLEKLARAFKLKLLLDFERKRIGA
jgi:antitoxin HicB